MEAWQPGDTRDAEEEEEEEATQRSATLFNNQCKGERVCGGWVSEYPPTLVSDPVNFRDQKNLFHAHTILKGTHELQIDLSQVYSFSQKAPTCSAISEKLDVYGSDPSHVKKGSAQGPQNLTPAGLDSVTCPQNLTSHSTPAPPAGLGSVTCPQNLTPAGLRRVEDPQNLNLFPPTPSITRCVLQGITDPDTPGLFVAENRVSFTGFFL